MRVGASSHSFGTGGAAGGKATCAPLTPPTFLRQNALIASAWGPGTVQVCEQVPGRHHMNVLHELAEPASRTRDQTVSALASITDEV